MHVHGMYTNTVYHPCTEAELATHTRPSYVTVLEKRDHLATNIIFELCISSKNGYCELQNGL